jgi:hypothetical protein
MLGSGLGQNTATGAIKCVYTAIVAVGMLTLLKIVGTKLPRGIAQHLGRPWRPDPLGRCILDIKYAHQIFSSPKAELQKGIHSSCSSDSAWPGWCQPDLIKVCNQLVLLCAFNQSQ